MRTEGPLFHMHEVTGEMTRIVKEFLEGKNLTLLDLNRLRVYMHQWVTYTVDKPPTYQNILVMNQSELMDFYVDELIPRGIDPF